jgi:sec-independent protein translocase protein TatA
MFLSMMNPVLLFSLPGGGEWILIILVVLLLFGGKKIPELMRGIGRGMREFNDAKSSVKNEIEEGMKEKPNPTVPANPATPPSPQQEPIK